MWMSFNASLAHVVEVVRGINFLQPFADVIFKSVSLWVLRHILLIRVYIDVKKTNIFIYIKYKIKYKIQKTYIK